MVRVRTSRLHQIAADRRHHDDGRRGRLGPLRTAQVAEAGGKLAHPERIHELVAAGGHVQHRLLVLRAGRRWIPLPLQQVEWHTGRKVLPSV